MGPNSRGAIYKMEAARVACQFETRHRQKCEDPVHSLEAIEMARGGPPRMREEAGDGNFKLQIKKKLGHF